MSNNTVDRTVICSLAQRHLEAVQMSLLRYSHTRIQHIRKFEAGVTGFINNSTDLNTHNTSPGRQWSQTKVPGPYLHGDYFLALDANSVVLT